MEPWGNIILAILTVIGLAEVIRWAANSLLTPRKEGWAVIVVPLQGEEDAEFLLRSAIGRVRWSLWRGRMKVICLDCGMGRECREVCLRMCECYSFVQIVKKEEMQKFFSGQGFAFYEKM